MILVDSNIIIYSSFPENKALRDFIFKNNCSVSVISKVETLGYYKLKIEERDYLIDFFKIVKQIDINGTIIEIAIALRQNRKMTLGDSLIAATAKAYKLSIATNNSVDFKNLGIEIINPLNIV